MKLFKISQKVNNGYDTYDSSVVCAENEEKAQYIHPGKSPEKWDGKDESFSSWCAVENVKVEYIGEAKEGTEEGVIVSSFNAG